MNSVIICNSNKGFFKECNKEENVEVTWAAATSCLKRKLYKFVSNVVYSPGHHQAGSSVIDNQETFRTALDRCKNVSLVVLFGRNSNSYSESTQSDMYVYILIFSQCRDAGRAKGIKEKLESCE